MNKIKVLFIFLCCSLFVVSCNFFHLKGEYADEGMGLSLEVLSQTKEALTVKLSTVPKYADGFKSITGEGVFVDVMRHKSLLGRTYYSATVKISLAKSSDRIVFRTRRGHESITTIRRSVSAKWWNNKIIIELDRATKRIQNVKFLWD